MRRIDPFLPLTAAARAASLSRTLSSAPDDIWVFAYGSLIWKPAFPVAERRRAALHGARRSFCIWSVLARGTPDRPGLGLGLVAEPAARCEGVALKIRSGLRDEALATLWEREMWTDVYFPVWRDLETAEGPLRAIVFEVNTESRQYAGALSDGEVVRLIRAAQGKFGTCRDYLRETVSALRQCGIACEMLSKLDEAVNGTN